MKAPLQGPADARLVAAILRISLRIVFCANSKFCELHHLILKADQSLQVCMPLLELSSLMHTLEHSLWPGHACFAAQTGWTDRKSHVCILRQIYMALYTAAYLSWHAYANMCTHASLCVVTYAYAWQLSLLVLINADVEALASQLYEFASCCAVIWVSVSISDMVTGARRSAQPCDQQPECCMGSSSCLHLVSGISLSERSQPTACAPSYGF